MPIEMDMPAQTATTTGASSRFAQVLAHSGVSERVLLGVATEWRGTGAVSAAIPIEAAPLDGVTRLERVSDLSWPSPWPLGIPDPSRVEPRNASRRQLVRLAARLHAAFDADYLEDGMFHPAERTIEQTLRSGKSALALEGLRSLSLDAENPTFAASVLRCLARVARPGTKAWRVGLVRDGLAADDPEIRDAAVQAAEEWADPALRTVLEAHTDPLPWLQDYIRDVIVDLRE